MDIVIERAFAAGTGEVWKAWSEPERMRAWWGPEGFSAPVCTMDFRVGGRIHFCMRSPEGRDSWACGTYLEIVEGESFVCTDSFADEEGNVVPASSYGLPASFPLELRIRLSLAKDGRGTRMRLIHEGFADPIMAEATEESWSQSFDKLERYLAEGTRRGPPGEPATAASPAATGSTGTSISRRPRGRPSRD